MNQELYIIYSPGRTGSHIILETLAGEYGQAGGLCCTQPYWHGLDTVAFDPNIHQVIHTHNLSEVVAKLKLDTAKTTLILSQRRDIFAQTMSTFVAQLAGEWSGKDYSDRIISPVSVPADQFCQLVNRFRHWYSHLDLPQFKKTVVIYYEDIVTESRSQHIADILGIDYDQNHLGTVHRKSPYRYKDCIENWPELYQEFLAMNCHDAK